jgi:hypothetical protein
VQRERRAYRVNVAKREIGELLEYKDCRVYRVCRASRVKRGRKEILLMRLLRLLLRL